MVRNRTEQEREREKRGVTKHETSNIIYNMTELTSVMDIVKATHCRDKPGHTDMNKTYFHECVLFYQQMCFNILVYCHFITVPHLAQ